MSAESERTSLNGDWRFIKGDPAEAAGQLDYSKIKAWVLPSSTEFDKTRTQSPWVRPPGNPGGEVAYVQKDFNDSQWRLLNLPHDWGIESPFNQDYSGDTGKLPWWGIGWYRKHLTVPATDSGKQIYLDVDGAMSYATVWINGQFVGGWPYGYTSWRVDLTPFIKFGEENVLSVRLDNPNQSSRWYPGGGIYRNVWLVKTAPIHVAHWGTFVTTPVVNPRSASVNFLTLINNDSSAETNVLVKSQLFELNPDGTKGKKPVASLTPINIKIAAHHSSQASSATTVLQPRLWSLETPFRYVFVTTLEQDGKPIDSYETPFGIRTIKFDPEHGFLLNGKRVPLNGVCDHHDLGALGTAINTRALDRQVEILKSMGCNAIRTSHNPPAPELLDACDRLGMVVMDEAFDCWKSGKNDNDYHQLFADWHERDVRSLIRRDRNHPCVILWSMGNEIPDQGTAEGPRLAAELSSIARFEDASRPTTAACDHINSGYDDFRKGLDVFGYNYKPFEYGKFHKVNPLQPLFGSETASCISSRGEYFFPVSDNPAEGKSDFQMSSYDLYAPGWATTPDAEFAGQDKNPSVAGEFVWTGFDYLGEPTPYNADMSNLSNFTDPIAKARLKKELEELGKIKVPSRSSYFGIIDLAGFPKDRFYLYQAHWRPDFPMAHLLPHWNWPDRVGQVTPVHVYTSGDSAELFLNGKSLGLKKKGPFEYRLRWNDVVYQPGELKVVAYKNGKKWATDTMKTTSVASKLLLEADRPLIAADGQDLSFVSVTIADKTGLLVPRSKNHVQFAIEGPGEIVAVDNGDATSFETFQAPEHDAYNGRVLVVIRSKAHMPGTIILKATSPGCGSEKVAVKSK